MPTTPTIWTSYDMNEGEGSLIFGLIDVIHQFLVRKTNSPSSKDGFERVNVRSHIEGSSKSDNGNRIYLNFDWYLSVFRTERETLTFFFSVTCLSFQPTSAGTFSFQTSFVTRFLSLHASSTLHLFCSHLFLDVSFHPVG